MKILREGRFAFVVRPHIGIAFNLDMVSKILIEDLYGQKNDEGERVFHLTVFAPTPVTTEVTLAEARQLLMDTPWMCVIPREKP